VNQPLPAQRKDLLGSIYDRLANEENARVCRDIPEAACTNVPRNFFTILGASALSKLGDELMSPKTVLAWVLGFVGAPASLIGLLVPIRESGSLIPQLAIATVVRRLAIRKWVWVIGSVLQFLAVLGIAACVFALHGAAAGWAIIGCLVLFSLARGMCSVSSKDVLGKTIAKTRRGLLTGWAASTSGGIAIAMGAVLMLVGQGQDDPRFYGLLLVGAGVLWLIAAGVYSLVVELPGATAGGGNAGAQALEQLKLLRDDRPFRNFVITRALLLSTALTAPYYILLARETAGSMARSLGLFVIAAGLAGLMSAPVWGRMSDVSSRMVIIRAALSAGLLGVVTFLLAQFTPLTQSAWWLIPVLYFLLCIAHSGVRLGRKTYLVDMAGGNKRTDYVAVSNTVIGALLLLSGLAGAAASFIPPQGMILGFSLVSCLGAVLGYSLPEVQQD